MIDEKANNLHTLYQIIQYYSGEEYKIEETYDNGVDTYTLFTSHRNYVFKFVMEETYHEGKAVSKFLNLEKVTSYSNVDNILNERIEYEDYSHNDKYFNKVLLIKNLLSLCMEAQKEWKERIYLDD